MTHFLSYGIAVVLLASCTFGSNFDVDFTQLPSQPNWFQVTYQRTSELNSLPADCYIGGIPAADFDASQAVTDAVPMPAAVDADENADENGDLDDADRPVMRTSPVTVANIVQNLLDNRNRKKVIELSGTYWSVDTDGQPVQLSGKVVLPADGKADRIILVSHYTIAANYESPSRCFPIEGIMAELGYVMIFPDYLGYGITSDSVHPYLVMNTTATNVLDMLFAVRPFLAAAGVEIANDDIFLMGYSQGGATTMAVQYLIETQYEDEVKLRRVFAGGGPYDVLATYDHFVTTDNADYPIAVPLVMQGMVCGNKLNVDMQELMQPRIYENLNKWVNSKEYTTAQVNKEIGTHVTHEILSAKGMDRTSVEVSELYKAMTANSILSYSWVPEAPVYLLHSMDDEIVTFKNASRARTKWAKANIQYNFGHYGSHIKGFLRFVSSVEALLKEDQKEEKKR